MNHPRNLGLAAVLLTAFACSNEDATPGNAGVGTDPSLAVPNGSTGSTPDAGTSAIGTGTAAGRDGGAAGPGAGFDAGGPGAGALPDAGTRADGGSAGDAGSATDAAAGGGPVSDGGPASDGGSAADGGAAGAPDAFAKCVAGLKPKCSFEDRELACSSIMTASIPLTGGGTWGNIEVKAGPYGAYVEWNEGKAFANPVNLLEGTCDVLAGTFGEPDSVTKDVLNLRGQELSLYTVFRPACMKEGEKYPVITWGNGTCGQSGGYGGLLANLASHGFVVFSPNSRFTDAGNKEMLRALDFAKAANEDNTSPLYHKLDLDKVGAMGHSQGGSATVNAASDPRIKAVILWNGGGSAVKPFLAVSGERDIGDTTPASMASAVNAAAQPGAWLYYHKVLQTGGNVTGHLTLMEQPERVTDVTVAWWKYMLQGDLEAKKMFVGADCGLCNKKDEFEFGQKGMK
jgi:hypothetical protein